MLADTSRTSCPVGSLDPRRRDPVCGREGMLRKAAGMRHLLGIVGIVAVLMMLADLGVIGGPRAQAPATIPYDSQPGPLPGFPPPAAAP
jgi:hypothetical protein